MDPKEQYRQACKAFFGNEPIADITPYGEGHINTTMLVCINSTRYILQRMNTTVFPSPDDVMHNIYGVTSHLRAKGKETLEVVPTINGELYCKHETGCYRLYRFIENTVTYQSCPDAKTLYYAGKAFGEFQNDLCDFEVSSLKEIIPDFHNTPKRFEAFEKAVQDDACKRLAGCVGEVQFVMQRKNTYSGIVDALACGAIPVRITHNDTKLNNILMDRDTNKARAIIDLDTVMPGSLLYDFGDAIRFGASTGAEDEKELALIRFDIEAFKAYADGYLEALRGSITEQETELMPYSAYLMTMECGMRFLTDYLAGDVYFSTRYPDHNLVRCRTQFKLASEMEKQFDTMKHICYAAVRKQNKPEV
ncbi:MAG: aminoglycoside phosphotransferase family protein [Ruminococcaceae bacterium]|nr:aminoglycoside phosphotransferase family protein [Oscillospiraceae bacterium]